MAEHKTLAQALAAFQAELPKLRKDEVAKVTGENAKTGARVSYSYSYAGLDAVVETVLPVLGKHGLSIISTTVMNDGSFILMVTLLHESGEREDAIWPLPDPRRAGPQDLGSAMTYGRRYLTLALTGTFPGGEDDDGKQAQQSTRDNWDQARPRSAPPATAQEVPAPKTSWTDDEVQGFLSKFGTESVDRTVAAYDWMAGKNLHSRAVAHPDPAEDVRVTATDMLALRLADEAMQPDASLSDIKGLQSLASDRGLLKVQVSATETLAEALFSAQELAAHAAAAQAKADAKPDAE